MRIFILLWALFSCVSLRAAPNVLGIAVKVSGEASNEISSYIKRELREFKDVSIVDVDEADTIVEVISIQTPNQSGGRSGYALSVVTISPFQTDIFSNLLVAAMSKGLSQPVNEDMAKVAHQSVDGMTRLEDHSVWFALPDDLKSVCQKIVAHVDAHVLETYRMSWTKFERALGAEGVEVVPNTNKAVRFDFRQVTNSPSGKFDRSQPKSIP